MRTLLLASLLIASVAHADGAKKKSSKPDFSMPDLPALPKGDGMSTTKTDDPSVQTKHPADPSKAKYTLASVQHAQQFVSRGDRYEARYVLDKIEVVNLPMTVPPFHTLVRVTSSDKLGASIEVRLVDPKGIPVVTSQGSLLFGGHEEAEFLVDWDPFTLKNAGTYQVEVTVAGLLIGKQAFPVVQQMSAHLSATPTDAGPPPAPEAPKETWP